jgi:hypothetical protein
MKDRSLALLFRSEIEQERAAWVDLTDGDADANNCYFAQARHGAHGRGRREADIATRALGVTVRGMRRRRK